MAPRRVLAAVLAAVVLAAGPAAARAEDLRALWTENRRLAAEVELAQKTKSYFLLDLGQRRIALKARGIVLKEMPIVDLGFWGRRPAIGLTKLERKDPLNRPAIVPGEEKTQENLDEQILELADMPADYRFSVAGGIEVQVLPAVEGFKEQWRRRAVLSWWHLTRPLVTLRDRRQRRESSTLYLVLRPEDARALYWSFYEGIEGIVVPP